MGLFFWIDMKHWVISDTHLGHEACKKFCGRPDHFEDKILKACEQIAEDDVLIHLGDVSFHDDHYWQGLLRIAVKGKLWLVRGNHDSRSDTWYLNEGWDFVADQMTLKRFGKIIVFSHTPVADNGYDFNIHGHFHNTYHHLEPELVAIKNDKQILVACEHDYRPFVLRKLIHE